MKRLTIPVPARADEDRVRSDVRYWHLADKPTVSEFVRYWG
jgi:hypothetical protein